MAKNLLWPFFVAAIIALLLLSACSDDDHEFTPYSGAQQKWAYAPGAFVSTPVDFPEQVSVYPEFVDIARPKFG